jgi:hypothetical protein
MLKPETEKGTEQQGFFSQARVEDKALSLIVLNGLSSSSY